MRVFVTGATGAIGRRTIPLLVAAGHQVTAVGRSFAACEQLRRMGAAAVTVDLFDRDGVRRAMAGHDAAVNLATHIPRGAVAPFLPGAWRENDRIRKQGSRLLVEAALANRVERFVQESFAPIYPDSGKRWIPEDVAPQVVRYNRTVLDAEASAQRFGREGGGCHVILRFAFLYGTGDPFTRLALETVRRGWFPLLGEPDGFVSLLHHEDAASAVLTALGLPAGTYNVIDDEPITRRKFADGLATILRVTPPKLPPPWLLKVTGSLGELMARSLRISNGKLRTLSRWSPRYPSVREGFRAALRACG